MVGPIIPQSNSPLLPPEEENKSKGKQLLSKIYEKSLNFTKSSYHYVKRKIVPCRSQEAQRVSSTTMLSLDERLRDIAAQINNDLKPIKDFELSKAELQQIFPHLEYADFKDCELIDSEFSNKEFQRLIDSNHRLGALLINSPKIKSLKVPSSIYILEITECERLKHLDLSNATNLNDLTCTDCNKLKSLDLSKTTSLLHLNCNDCPFLKKLDISGASDLQSLHCSSCWYLKLDLSKNQFLEILDCSSCGQIIDLDIPSSLTELNCTGCFRLETLNLSNASELTKLNCEGCRVLTNLDLSRSLALREIDCQFCHSLTTLTAEALPQCMYLNYRSCESLIQLPQLHEDAIVLNDENRGDLFNIDLAELKQNSLKILLELGRNFLLLNKGFPCITFQDSPGIDAGGLRRHLVSTLFKNLVSDETLFTGEDQHKLPKLPADNQDQDKIDTLKTIGRLFAFSLNSSLLTGVHFDEHLFTTIRWIMDNDDPIPDHFNERIYCKLKGWEYDSEDIATIRDSLPEYIEDDPIVYPTILIATEIKKTLRTPPRTITDKEFRQKIQGISVDKTTLLSKIQWEGRVSPEQLSQMKNLLENWIQQQDPKRLEDFVLFATGSNSLAQNITIELFPSRSSNSLPVAHTCIQLLEMPLYRGLTQDEFNAKLDLALTTIESFEIA